MQRIVARPGGRERPRRYRSPMTTTDTPTDRARPGLVGFRLAPLGSEGLDWGRLDETWALAGELDAFSAGWMSDHLSDAGQERNGPAFESLTMAAALATRVPGKWVGIAVLAN